MLNRYFLKAVNAYVGGKYGIAEISGAVPDTYFPAHTVSGLWRKFFARYGRSNYDHLTTNIIKLALGFNITCFIDTHVAGVSLIKNEHGFEWVVIKIVVAGGHLAGKWQCVYGLSSVRSTYIAITICETDNNLQRISFSCYLTRNGYKLNSRNIGISRGLNTR